MAEMFSDAWMKRFMESWNAEQDLVEPLSSIGFNSVIGYGYPGEPTARGYLDVQNGKAVDAGAFNGQNLNWDLRAKAEQWEKWMASPPGMTGLGGAFMTGKIKFLVGDYKAMLKEPRMAGPFIKSFSVMGKV
ncbi:MAG: SCP-2 sterol transfer family protein [Thioalkalivibrionaceae bacterium]